MKERERNNYSLEELGEFIEALQSLPPRHLPLHNNNTCPYCRYFLYKTVNTPVECVSEVECLNSHGIFYFDDRNDLNL